MNLERILLKHFIIANPDDSVCTYNQQLIDNKPIAIIEQGKYLGLLNLSDAFNKSDKRIADVLTSKPTVSLNDRPLDVLHLMNNASHDFLAVIDNAEFRGIISRKQLFNEILASKQLNNNDGNKHDFYHHFSEKEGRQLNSNKFLMVVSHDIKNLFNQIMGALEILNHRLRNSEDPKVSLMIKLAQKSIGQVNIAFDGILLWARLGAGQLPFTPTKLLLNERVTNAIDSLELAIGIKRIRVRNFTSTKSISISADKNMLDCILLNLLYNAIKFSSMDGEIWIDAFKNHHETGIVIKDCGQGMSEKQLEGLFTKEETSKGTNNETGNGIGLIICKEFVERHGGKIEIQSTVGVGTSVSVVFPITVGQPDTEDMNVR